MTKLKENLQIQIAVIYTRYLIGGAFVFASMIKIKGNRFTTLSGENEPINSSWHLFETLYQSGIYWKFIGIGQLIAGFLLMTQRYSKLGVIIGLPILANIFVITISYYFAFTPVITGLMLFAGIMLFIWEWNELKILFNLTPETSTAKNIEDDKVWEVTGLILFLFTMFYRIFVNSYDIFLWSGIFFITGLAGLMTGLRKIKKRKIKKQSL